MPWKIIVGLGNPGREYRMTRHNMGFWAIDILAEKLEARWQKVAFKSSLAFTNHGAWNLVLAKPRTFMNLSGQAVQSLLAYYKCNLNDLIILCDDIALPIGKIRLRAKGSAGGHHGLESIIAALGTAAFPRIRIGIKPLDYDAPGNLSEFVLQRFNRGEEAIAAESAKRTADAVFMLLEKKMELAMTVFNT